ncbi:hypothetical protein GMPD_14160 [Geomonas paludis]|uniref:Uncharacterized protein n=1 Tax=Geomonas paludis TaxID=2740185 RepID=A0A6V8MUV4_9BACT|nr:hypothetical protein GMPD_14160 [Geomonas paludis]
MTARGAGAVAAEYSLPVAEYSATTLQLFHTLALRERVAAGRVREVQRSGIIAYCSALTPALSRRERGMGILAEEFADR